MFIIIRCPLSAHLWPLSGITYRWKTSVEEENKVKAQHVSNGSPATLVFWDFPVSELISLSSLLPFSQLCCPKFCLCFQSVSVRKQNVYMVCKCTIFFLFALEFCFLFVSTLDIIRLLTTQILKFLFTSRLLPLIWYLHLPRNAILISGNITPK